MAQLVIAWTGVVIAFLFGMGMFVTVVCAMMGVVKLDAGPQWVGIMTGSMCLFIAWSISKAHGL